MLNDIIETIKNMPDLLPLQPASDTQITDAEIQLRVRFAEDYKKYLKTYGAIIANGIELSGIAKSEHRNVISLTKKERELNPKVPNTMYVIENTCIEGIIIWQDKNGDIYQTQPGTEPKKIASSLVEYIKNYKL